MKNKIRKGILGIFALTLSPLLLLSATGILYILYQLIGGRSLSAGYQSYMKIIYSLVPYFLYLTVIPILLFIVFLIIKYRHKITNLLRK